METPTILLPQYRYRLWSGGLSIVLPVLFLVALITCSPWHYSVYDFIIRPMVLFVIPLILTGVYALCCRRDMVLLDCFISIYILLSIPLIGLAAIVWPTPGLPTSWEDSFGSLLPIEGIIFLGFVPIWICNVMLLIGVVVREHTRRTWPQQ
jgi:hypothetical protein